MKKNIYSTAILALIGLWLLTVLMKKHAERAKAVSEKILQDFKTVDESLQKTNSSLREKNDSLLNELKELKDTNKSQR